MCVCMYVCIYIYIHTRMQKDHIHDTPIKDPLVHVIVR